MLQCFASSAYPLAGGNTSSRAEPVLRCCRLSSVVALGSAHPIDTGGICADGSDSGQDAMVKAHF